MFPSFVWQTHSGGARVEGQICSYLLLLFHCNTRPINFWRLVQLSEKAVVLCFWCEWTVLSEKSMHLYSSHAGSIDCGWKWIKTDISAGERKSAFAEKSNSGGVNSFPLSSQLWWAGCLVQGLPASALVKESEIRGAKLPSEKPLVYFEPLMPKKKKSHINNFVQF